MKKSTSCLFFETTGNLECPFHKVKLVGELSYYAVKRNKLKYPYKRIKNKRRPYGQPR